MLLRACAQAVADALAGPLVVAKGAADTVCSAGCEARVVREEGAPRRCGGQGDLLSGLLGTTVSWAVAYSRARVRITRACWPSSCSR